MRRKNRPVREQGERLMIFVYRAAIVAVGTFASALAGFGVQWLLPAAYAAESKGMTGSIVGLVASLLSLVLGLLIWTSHGLFTDQQSQLQTIGRSMVLLDLTLKEYGLEAKAGRALLRDHMARIRGRLWDTAVGGRRFIYHSDLPTDILAMRAFFFSLHPTSEEQRHQLASAREVFGTLVETQLTMLRTLTDPVPRLLLNIVFGWACLLFFGYGLLATFDPLTVALAALGAIAVASAVFLILELSDPYAGLFKLGDAGVEHLIRAMLEAE